MNFDDYIEYDGGGVDAVQIIRAVAEQVPPRDAAERYGMKIGRNNRALCVWHDDKHPDLTFYGSHCYCHACHNGGDAVALTAKLFNISMWDAAAKLAKDFNLKLDAGAVAAQTGPSRAELRRQERERANREFGLLCKVEQQADARLREMTSDGKDWDSLWDDPHFVSVLRARSVAGTALDECIAKGGE